MHVSLLCSIYSLCIAALSCGLFLSHGASAQVIERNQSLWQVQGGKDTVKMNHILSFKPIGAEAWQVKTGDSEYLISRTGDSLVPVRDELMPTGENWKAIEKNYGQICACLESSETSKADALRIAKAKGYIPDSDATYDLRWVVVRQKFSCLWQIEVFNKGANYADPPVVTIQVDMSNGHIAGKKFGE